MISSILIKTLELYREENNMLKKALKEYGLNKSISKETLSTLKDFNDKAKIQCQLMSELLSKTYD